jgi:hypothetical protein
MEAPPATMRERMENPALIIPEAMEPIQSMHGAAHKGGVPPAILAKELAALLLMIAVTNVCNRLNVATGQVAGAWG